MVAEITAFNGTIQNGVLGFSLVGSFLCAPITEDNEIYVPAVAEWSLNYHSVQQTLWDIFSAL